MGWQFEFFSKKTETFSVFLSGQTSIFYQKDNFVVSVSIDFPINSKQGAPFQYMAYGYTLADWDGLCDHLRDYLWDDIFKLSASAAANKFCQWVQV